MSTFNRWTRGPSDWWMSSSALGSVANTRRLKKRCNWNLFDEVVNKRYFGQGMKRVELSTVFYTRTRFQTERERLQQANKYHFCLLCSRGSEGWKDLGFFQPFHPSLFVLPNHPGISSQLASRDSETFFILPVPVIGVCETWQLTFSQDKCPCIIFPNPEVEKQLVLVLIRT